MCLILMALSSHPKYPLIVAANRDEFYARPTAGAAFWTDAPHVLAGRDLRDGGTWLGVSTRGRFAAVTNYRGGETALADPISRGALVGDYLTGSMTTADYFARVAQDAQHYRGFSLIAGIGAELCYFANRGGAPPQALAQGVHVLSNHLLNTPWPKVERARAGLEALLGTADVDADSVLDLLRDRTPAAADELPDTGIGVERESQLSPIFIRTEQYGTRSSTLLLIDTHGEVRFTERTFVAGEVTAQESFAFRLDAVSA